MSGLSDMSGNKVTVNQEYLFDFESKVLTDLEGGMIVLGENEKRILSIFVKNKNKVISKKKLIEHVWNSRGLQVNESSVIQAISSLRRNLGDSIKSPKLIKTVPRVGYKFIGEVDSVRTFESKVIQKPLSNKYRAEEIGKNVIDDSNINESSSGYGGNYVYDSEFFYCIVLVLFIFLLLSLFLFNFNESKMVLMYLYNKVFCYIFC